MANETFTGTGTGAGSQTTRSRKPFLTSIAAQLTMSQVMQREMTVGEIQGYLEGTFDTLLSMRTRELYELSVKVGTDYSNTPSFAARFRLPFEDGSGENDGLEGGADGSSLPGNASSASVSSIPPTSIPAISPADSIQEDKVICMECGKEFKQLTQKHLFSFHGLSPREYKRKHGMKLKTPLAARSVSASRSEAAKARGVPENLRAFQEERRNKKVRAFQEERRQEKGDG